MTSVRGIVVCAVLGASVSAAALGLPPSTVAYEYRSGQQIPGVGQINSPFFGGANGGSGFLGLAVGNGGTGLAHVGVFASPGFEQAVLRTPTGLAAYLAAGAEDGDPGSVTVPSAEYVVDAVYSTSINNQGNSAIALRLRAASSLMVAPVSGVFFNTTAMPVREGDPVTAAGVAPGTVFAPFNASSRVMINDGQTVLIGSRVVESGMTKNAVLKVQLDATGSVVSQTLVAKEGGPVGAGPDTWASLSVGPHTMAMNNAGSVIFGGVTAGGVNGLFLNGAFVARMGDAGPVAGSMWGPLAGAPVDLNNAGVWAVRAPLQGDGLWTEQGEAGETLYTFQSNGNFTLGGGPLTEIIGQLQDDHDVDVYAIFVGDPALPVQEAFSATTVPNPGAGFAGAAFDTVLYLFRDFHNANGAFRTGVGRCDNAAPGVVQSTLTTASLPNGHTPGTRYFLAVATPKARVLTGFGAPSGQMWQDDPGALAVVGGNVFWIDPSEGQIGRASVGGGLLSPLQVGVIPPQTVGQVAEDAPLLAPLLAAYDAGAASKLYFLERRFFPSRVKRCNPDGSNIETVMESSTGSPPVSNMLAMTIDSVNGRFYWSRIQGDGSINSSDLDGGARQSLVTIVGGRATALAVDGAGGKLYWYEPGIDSLRRSNLDGTSVETVVASAGVRSMAADVAGRRLYWTTAAGSVRRLDLDTGAAITDLLATAMPGAIAVDSAAGQVYWSYTPERRVRRAAIAMPLEQNFVVIGEDVGERPADGTGYLDSFNSWQRIGAAGAGPLPYRVRLTGATYANALAVISRGNTKVAMAGEVYPSTAPDAVTTVGALTSPVKISDSGAVAWRGRWTSTVAPTGTRTALFINTEEVLRDNSQPTGGGPQLGAMTAGGYGMDVSDDGRHILLEANNGSFDPQQNAENCVRVTFATAPGCPADFNGSGAVTVQDIFDFLGAYFANIPSADFNGSGAVTVQDIFDFLGAYFTGC